MIKIIETRHYNALDTYFLTQNHLRKQKRNHLKLGRDIRGRTRNTTELYPPSLQVQILQLSNLYGPFPFSLENDTTYEISKKQENH